MTGNKGIVQHEQAMARRRKIKAIVLRAGTAGVASSAISKACSLSAASVLEHLNALRASGDIEPSHNIGRCTRWGPPGTYDAHQAMRDRPAPQRERRQAAREAGQAVRLDATVAQRVPSSVWGLAT